MEKFIPVAMSLLILFAALPAKSADPNSNEALRKEVEALKSQMKQMKQGQPGGGLKTEDYKGTTIDSSAAVPKPSAPAGSQPPQISPEQQADIQKQMQQLKKNIEQQNKALQEIDQSL